MVSKVINVSSASHQQYCCYNVPLAYQDLSEFRLHDMFYIMYAMAIFFCNFDEILPEKRIRSCMINQGSFQNSARTALKLQENMAGVTLALHLFSMD